jgi:tetratricopeptide (TPR) repeat protein
LKGPVWIKSSLALTGDVPEYPELDDLQPLFDAIHYYCKAGVYQEAFDLMYEKVYQETRFVLTNQLGAHDIAYELALKFFPDGDISQPALIDDPRRLRWILNDVGFCLMNLGRLREATPFYERAINIMLEMEDWRNASTGYRNLAALHISLGELGAAAEAADRALALAQRAENKKDERNSLLWQAWAAHLNGEWRVAGEAFQQAEALEQEIDSSVQYLYSLRGVQHADHLRRTSGSSTALRQAQDGSSEQVDYARRVTEANLAICERSRWPDDTSRCRRVLGDLDAQEGNHPDAREHYDRAVSIARGISHRPALIEALLGRGRWAAKGAAETSEVFAKHSEPGRGAETSEVSRAFNDLDEALGYATAGGYRRYEADIRVALAWAHLAAGDTAKARAEARRALQLSGEMGYHWGQVDAEEVLGELEGEENAD